MNDSFDMKDSFGMNDVLFESTKMWYSGLSYRAKTDRQTDRHIDEH